jgi:hypothetical protein
MEASERTEVIDGSGWPSGASGPLPSEMSKSSDFLHILSKADELSAQLTTFAEDLRRRSGLLVSQTLRQEVYPLLLRLTTVRARFS